MTEQETLLIEKLIQTIERLESKLDQNETKPTLDDIKDLILPRLRQISSTYSI